MIAWTKGEKREESDNWPRVYVYSEQLNKPLKDLANRAKFELEPKKGAFLIIDTLKYSDEANYKCDVTYIHPGKCPSITFINLNISGKRIFHYFFVYKTRLIPFFVIIALIFIVYTFYSFY